MAIDHVWVVTPTYDEAENLERFVEATLPALARSPVRRFSLLIVDDDSPDGTGEIADWLALRHANVRVLHRSRKHGLAGAYVDGFRLALSEGASHVVEMDADLSHDPADLPRILAAASAGAEVVLGSRYVAGGAVTDWGPLRRVVSRTGCWYARTVLGVGVRDLTGGFKCLSAQVLRDLELDHLDAHGYAFQVELTYRALDRRHSVVEVPIRFRDRRAGHSKMTAGIAAEAAWLVPAMRLRHARDAATGALEPSRPVARR